MLIDCAAGLAFAQRPAEFCELGTQLIGFGVVEVVEHAQSLPPCRLSAVGVAGGVVGVA